LICASVAVYSVSYIANFLIRGFLPFFTVGRLSRLDFNVSGLTLFLYSVSFIIFFTVLYHLMIRGKKGRKTFLTIMTLIAVGSNLLLLSRYQIVMAIIICFTLLYYASRYIRFRTVASLFLVVTAFFYWISSLRLSNVVATFMYSASKMRFPKEYAFLTEPYMYVAMNLENFARSVNWSDYHTYGYFTFDFIAAITGLKYWILEYFNLDRTPYLISNYNTYTAFWWFYSDFGVVGLALIPLLLGLGAGLLYYRMRSRPTIKNVTAYAVMVFVMFISYFNFPVTYLFFESNLLAMYLFLRWTMIPRKGYVQLRGDPTHGVGRNLL
jgi:oligosaccharide repeat unit polymerase